MADVSVIHHVEYCVKDEKALMDTLITGFGFRVSHIRYFPSAAIQWVLISGSSVFVVTKHLKTNTSFQAVIPNGHTSRSSKHYFTPNIFGSSDENALDQAAYPLLFCSSADYEHIRDSAFNIAMEVQDVDIIVRRVELNGDSVLMQPFDISDKNGKIRVAIIASQCPNIIHTLLDKSQYKGDFLPGFLYIDSFKKEQNGDVKYNIFENYLKPLRTCNDNLLCNYIDHVTYVCEPSASKNIIDWYKKIFKMQRLFANRDETVDEGFVLRDGIGLRLKALQYWRCAETGVASPTSHNNSNIMRIVIAEPLPEIGINSHYCNVLTENSHVSTFLRENGGPGVQHIALHCQDILTVVTKLKARGVKFRIPPPTYYAELGEDLNAIVTTFLSGHHEKLRSSGVLLDIEEDLISDGENPKFLMQIFSEPIFSKNTFFLEVIQRFGATGFGAGNITALARSIVRYEEENKKAEVAKTKEENNPVLMKLNRIN